MQLNWPSVANGNPEVDAWDTHAANFKPLKNLHCPVLDQSLSALLEDMHDRGLLDETLIMVNSEMGRKPKIGDPRSGGTNGGGRDHWTACQSVVLAGGGIQGGQTYGKTDQFGEYPVEKIMELARLQLAEAQ